MLGIEYTVLSEITSSSPNVMYGYQIQTLNPSSRIFLRMFKFLLSWRAAAMPAPLLQNGLPDTLADCHFQ
jgi:hypothetical protein